MRRVVIAMGLLALSSCSNGPAEISCRTNADCSRTTICIAGICRDPAFDGGAGADAHSVDAAATDAPRLDTGVPNDAWANDAAVTHDDTGIDAATSIDAARPIDAATQPDTNFVQPGESCANVIPLTLDGMGNAMAVANLGLYHFDYGNYCVDPAQLGRDVIFSIDVPDNSTMEITTSPGSVDTVVAVAVTCGSFDVACNDDLVPGNIRSSRLVLHRTTGNATFFIQVQGYDMSLAGTTTLHVHVQPAEPDGCSMPIDMSAGGTMLASVRGNSSYPTMTTDCAAWPAGNVDLVFLGTSPSGTIHGVHAYSGDFPVALAATHTTSCSTSSTGDTCTMTVDGVGFWTANLDMFPAGTPTLLAIGGFMRGNPAWLGRYTIDVSP